MTTNSNSNITLRAYCQPFASRYFASRVAFTDSDSLDSMLEKSEVYAQRDNLTSANAPFVYRGRAFGRELTSDEAKRVTQLINARAEGSGLITRAEFEDAARRAIAKAEPKTTAQ
jgi:hypothetical protein